MDSWTGRFLDGRSAQPLAVTIAASADGLAIDAADGGRIDLWPWADLMTEAAPTAIEARLGCRGRGLAALVVSDAGFAALVSERAPGLADWSTRGGAAATVGYGTLSLVILAGLLFGLVEAANLVVQLVPEELERRWGASYARSLTDDGGWTCDEPAGRLALDRLMARLVAAAEYDQPVTVHVVQASVVNAFALPGGHIVLFSELIDKAETGDEVAGVLSHELGHVAGRHALRRLVEHIGLASAVGMAFGGSAWREDDMITTLIDRSYSRAMETEADAYAIDLLRRAGISRSGLVMFFRRLERFGGDAPLALMSTHPSSHERAALVDYGDDGGPAMPEADWKALKQICDAPE